MNAFSSVIGGGAHPQRRVTGNGVRSDGFTGAVVSSEWLRLWQPTSSQPARIASNAADPSEQEKVDAHLPSESPTMEDKGGLHRKKWITNEIINQTASANCRWLDGGGRIAPNRDRNRKFGC